jgi:hypothetical protein
MTPDCVLSEFPAPGPEKVALVHPEWLTCRLEGGDRAFPMAVKSLTYLGHGTGSVPYVFTSGGNELGKVVQADKFDRRGLFRLITTA